MTTTTKKMFGGAFLNLLERIEEQNNIKDRMYGLDNTKLNEARSSEHELIKEATDIIIVAMRKGHGGYNFRNALPYQIGYIQGLKLYWNKDATLFQKNIEQYMPEHLRWIAYPLATRVDAILRNIP
jgi:ABC-type thiamine transport system substrate-binding protein